MNNTARRKVLVVGGGIAGLAAAFELEKSGADVEVLEASPRAGGILRTTRERGFLLEHGPDCFLTSKPEALELARELGLAKSLIGTIAENRRSFIARDRRLLPVPEGFYLMAPRSLSSLADSELFSPAGLERLAREPDIPVRRSDRDESLASFVRRRLGRECLERVAQPMVAGITTADPERLSMLASMPQFVAMERTHGSVIRALVAKRVEASGPRYGMFATFGGGMQVLADALAKRVRVTTGARVGGLKRRGDRWVVGGREADAVILALPAPAAARLLAPHDRRLAALLADVFFASVATVTVAWKGLELPRAMGFVVPAIERRLTVAASFTSRKFPGRAPAGVALVRAFAGGATRPRHASLPARELTQRVISELREWLGAKGPPLFARVDRFPASMPQYGVGHLGRVAEIERRAAALPSLALCGASYRGVGIPDCIRSGRQAARAAARG